jgi:hypothetical protein
MARRIDIYQLHHADPLFGPHSRRTAPFLFKPWLKLFLDFLPSSAFETTYDL